MRETTYCVGDLVLVKYNHDSLFDVDWDSPSYSKFSSKYHEVVAKIDSNYIILCPTMTYDNFEITQSVAARYNIESKHIGEWGFLITHKALGGRKTPDYYKNPLACLICKQAYPYALPNCVSGLICWACRNDPRNKFKIEELAK